MGRNLLLVFVLLLLMPLAMAAFPLDNLEMAWTFDNDINNTVIDANNTINGSSNNITYTTGKNGQGVYFHQLPVGAYTGSHINMTSAITTTKSICFWIQPFKEFINTSSGTAGFVTGQIGGVLDKSFLFGNWDGGITGEVITFTDVVNTHVWFWDHQALNTTGSNSTWHHTCIVDNDDINNITLWYDGVNRGQANTKGGPATPLSGLQLVFGEDGVGDGYLGFLDEVYFWSDALNSTEVAALYGGEYYPTGGAPPVTPTISGNNAEIVTNVLVVLFGITILAMIFVNMSFGFLTKEFNGVPIKSWIMLIILSAAMVTLLLLLLT